MAGRILDRFLEQLKLQKVR
uniref:Uncharacterized protein n=1 Tax=Arundo donax TaxID=35708 RepID=A0A0A9QM40_ARUDO